VLEERQLIRVAYGGLRILDLEGLRTAQFKPNEMSGKTTDNR
jgi:hypothetical protein